MAQSIYRRDKLSNLLELLPSTKEIVTVEDNTKHAFLHYGQLRTIAQLLEKGLGIEVRDWDTNFGKGEAGENSFDISTSLEEFGAGATGDYSTASGVDTKASGTHSEASGYMTIASGNNSHAEGSGVNASGDTSHAEGSGTIASGKTSHAEGTGNVASGENSKASGLNNEVTGKNAVVFGEESVVHGKNSFATGKMNYVFGHSSRIIGDMSVAGVATRTKQFNENNLKFTFFSLDEMNLLNGSVGDIVLSYYVREFVDPHNAPLHGIDRYAVWETTITEIDETALSITVDSNLPEDFHDIWNGTLINVTKSLLISDDTGRFSYGFQNSVLAPHAQAFGKKNLAAGTGSTTFGNMGFAKGQYSSTLGAWTIAKENYATAMGAYNLGLENTIQEVGIGSNPNSRKNAFEIYLDGILRAPESSDLTKMFNDLKTLVTTEFVKEKVALENWFQDFTYSVGDGNVFRSNIPSSDKHANISALFQGGIMIRPSKYELIDDNNFKAVRIDTSVVSLNEGDWISLQLNRVYYKDY